MKNIAVIVFSLIMSLFLVSCGAEDGIQDSIVTSTTDKIENSDKESDQAADLPIIYSPKDSADRLMFSLEWIDWLAEASLHESRGYAMCIVTVIDIDLSSLSETKGTRVPLKLRIDDVISANNSFGLKEGEVFLTADYSRWRKSGEGYSVNYHEGIVPITKCGAQYIVWLFEEEPDDSIGFEYHIESFTVPILPSCVTADDIAKLYAEMRLPEDIRITSAELIKRYYGENFIPGYDELETAFEKIAK